MTLNVTFIYLFIIFIIVIDTSFDSRHLRWLSKNGLPNVDYSKWITQSLFKDSRSKASLAIIYVQCSSMFSSVFAVGLTSRAADRNCECSGTVVLQ